MNENINRFSVNNILAIMFIISSEILLGFELTPLRITGNLHDLFLFISFVSLLVALLNSKWKLNELKRAVLLIIPGILIYYFSKESLILFLIGFALVVKILDYRTTLITIFIVRLVIFIIVISLSLFGVIPNNQMAVSKGAKGFVLGWQLGFTHPNAVAVSLFILILLYVCIKQVRITTLDYVFIFVLALIMTQVTKNRSTFVLTIILLVFMFFNKFEFIQKFVYGFSEIYILLISSIAIFIPMFYNSLSGTLQSVFFQLNGVLNDRLSNAAGLFQNFKLTWFGQIIDLNYLQQRFGYNIVDNGYVFTLFDFGIVGIIFILFLYCYSVRKFIKQHKYIYILIIDIFLTLVLMENALRTVAMNFTMIFWYEFIAIKEMPENAKK